MAIDVRSFSETTKKDVFTTRGMYCGRVTDISIDIERFKVKSLIVDAVKGSFLAAMVGNKKGVIIPYAMVSSVGDIILIKHVSPTSIEETQGEEEEALKV